MVGEMLVAAAVFGPMLAAAAGHTVGRKYALARDVIMFAACLLTLIASLTLAIAYPDAKMRVSGFGSLQLDFKLDGFRALFGCVAGFLWLVTTLFSPRYFARSQNVNRYWLFNMLTLGAVMGLFFSADFVTAFVFFEMLSLTSYPMVAHDGSPAALRAAETYLAVAVLGGLSILMGMILLHRRVGTVEFSALYEICASMPDKSGLYLPGALLIVGLRKSRIISAAYLASQSPSGGACARERAAVRHPHQNRGFWGGSGEQQCFSI